ncbi:MAG: hypothetical protein CMH62_00710 [Nanoarchaeota archaeon]|nr:hypothetical protein [Nanoarchaeota archaeon]|tara:strand:- start:1475 stop:2074 length:600 start_codon:yes stop_codon:yes gene_type:complete
MNVEIVDAFNRFAEQYADFTFNNILQYELNRFISLIPANGAVLDLGCGSGRDVQYFLDYKLNPLGIDASENLIIEARKRVEKGKFEVMDVNNLTLGDGSFDGVWAQDIVSYVPKDGILSIFKKLFNILRKDGMLFVSVRQGKDEVLIAHEKLGKKEILVAFFEKKELELLLKKSGFEISNSYTQDGEDFKWINVFAKKV